MTDVQEPQLVETASELSDAITDLCRMWAMRMISEGHQTDAVMALAGGAQVYSLAECVGQFVTPETIGPWSQTVARDLAKISSDLAAGRNSH